MFTAGVPLSAPVGEKLTPVGKVPVSLKAGAGNPDAFTWNESALPTVNAARAPVVKAGGWPTVNVNFWVAPLLAAMLIEYVPIVFGAGIPLSRPAAEKLTPAGSVPVSLNVNGGAPEAVTVNEPRLPTVNIVAAALVMASAWPMVNVKPWLSFGPTPLLAVMMMG